MQNNERMAESKVKDRPIQQHALTPSAMPTHREPKKPDLHLHLLRKAVLGLTAACPFDRTNPPACQLCEIRKINLNARFEWVSKLTLSEAQAIWGNHDKCLAKKKSQKAK
jgi:hypothetical protein